MAPQKISFYKEIYPIGTWLNIHVNHLGYVRNLIIILSTAGLGFTINQLQKEIVLHHYWKEHILAWAALAFVLSIAVGLYIAVNQEKNYRMYRQVSRDLERVADSDEEIDIGAWEPQKAISRIETRMKGAFPLQLWLFGLGVFGNGAYVVSLIWFIPT